MLVCVQSLLTCGVAAAEDITPVEVLIVIVVPSGRTPPIALVVAFGNSYVLFITLSIIFILVPPDNFSLKLLYDNVPKSLNAKLTLFILYLLPVGILIFPETSNLLFIAVVIPIPTLPVL